MASIPKTLSELVRGQRKGISPTAIKLIKKYMDGGCDVSEAFPSQRKTQLPKNITTPHKYQTSSVHMDQPTLTSPEEGQAITTFSSSPRKSPFLSPRFLLESVGILSEACYELFLKDKEPSPRIQKVSNIINAGVLGWRVYSRVNEAYHDWSPPTSFEHKESWTEIKFKHSDHMFTLVRLWVSKYASFVDPTAETLNVDIKNHFSITKDGGIIYGDPDQVKKMTLDTCVVPSGDVCFTWKDHQIQFTAQIKSEPLGTAPKNEDILLLGPEEKDQAKARKRWQDAYSPSASLRIDTRDKSILDELFEEIKLMIITSVDGDVVSEPTPYVYQYDQYDGWDTLMEVPERAAILPETYDKALVEDVSQFFNNKDWYKSVAVPHRRGYIFYGLPGTGKTSTVITLARQVGLDVYIINLNKLRDSKTFERAINRAGGGNCKGSILVFEDVDCVMSDRDMKTEVGNKQTDGLIPQVQEEPSLSFSEFLNVIDGITSREDQIIVFTTNKGLEDFDAALMRPGRIDVKVHFTYATPYQITKLVERFVGDDQKVVKDVVEEIQADGPVTMCQVQEYLIQRHFGQVKTL